MQDSTTKRHPDSEAPRLRVRQTSLIKTELLKIMTFEICSYLFEDILSIFNMTPSFFSFTNRKPPQNPPLPLFTVFLSPLIKLSLYPKRFYRT